MTYIFRPSHYNVTDSATARVYEPGGAAAALPWWNPDGLTPAATCGAWQAKGAASLAASYLNLATLGNANIDPAVVGGVAPTFGADGWTFNGLTQFLDTGIVAPTNPISYSMLVQFSNVASIGTTTLAGSYSAATGARFHIFPNNNPGLVTYGNGSLLGFLSVAPALLTGNLGIAGVQGYRNGNPDGAIPVSANVINALSAYIGARHIDAGAGNFVVATIAALAIYNVTLTALQVLARATAMAAL